VGAEEFVDAAGWVIGDACQHICEVVLRVEAVELCALEQGIYCPGATAAGVGEQIILPADRDAPQGALGRVIVESEPGA